MIVTVTPNPAIDITYTVPHIEFDEVLRTTEVRRVWAGKALNASRTLKRMGVESVVIAFAGGYTGRAIAEGLAEEGIATDFARVAGETRTVVAIVDQATGHFVKANPPGAAVTPAEHAAFLAKVRGRVQPGDLWVLTGSLPPGLPADFYAELIDLVQGAGAAAVLDTSGPALRLGCARRPFLVKPNAEEAEEMTGQPVDAGAGGVAAVNAFLAAGARRVALSLGPDGLLLGDGQQAVFARPPRVTVKTAVGAGDALVAGLVWAQTQGKDLAESARWGVTVGTTYAQRDELSLDPWPELQEMSRRVVVKLLPG